MLALRQMYLSRKASQLFRMCLVWFSMTVPHCGHGYEQPESCMLFPLRGHLAAPDVVLRVGTRLVMATLKDSLVTFRCHSLSNAIALFSDIKSFVEVPMNFILSILCWTIKTLFLQISSSKFDSCATLLCFSGFLFFCFFYFFVWYVLERQSKDEKASCKSGRYQREKEGKKAPHIWQGCGGVHGSHQINHNTSVPLWNFKLIKLEA